MDEFTKIPTFEILDRPPRRWRISLRRAMALVVVAACICAGLVYLGQAVQAAREAARRSQCVCNFCSIKLALHNYHSSYGELPPAYIADANGKPMHSWRVLILPFMELGPLYSRYNFNEPWDGPNNIKLLDEMPGAFACPSRLDRPRNLTSYVAIGGPGTMFPGANPVTFGDVTDGLAETLMVVEVSNVDIPWTSPRDLDVCMMSFVVNDPRRPGISSKHPGGANVAFGDASVHFLRESTSRGDLKALTTISGGERVSARAVISGE